jgi:hypothetical protein
MTMYMSKDVQCGHCGTISMQDMLASSNTCSGPDLDLRPAEMYRSAMDTWLQVCPNCHYCGYNIKNPPLDPAILESKAYRKILNSQKFPKLATLFLAYALLIPATDPAAKVQQYLHAAWVCDDAERIKLAQVCRGLAFAWIRKIRPCPNDENGATLALIAVDILRRRGKFRQALLECQTWLETPLANGYVLEVLEYQQKLILCHDMQAHEFAQCITAS